MEPDILLESLRDLSTLVNNIARDNLEAKKLNYSKDIRTLSLLKAIMEELVISDPACKARMRKRLNELMLLHGNDQMFGDGIKEAIAILANA